MRKAALPCGGAASLSRLRDQRQEPRSRPLPLNGWHDVPAPQVPGSDRLQRTTIDLASTEPGAMHFEPPCLYALYSWHAAGAFVSTPTFAKSVAGFET